MADYYTDQGSVIPNFRFLLRVDGLFDVPLKTVRAFTRENEYEYIQEGGQNDFVYLKRKPISKPFTIVVERYITNDVMLGLNDPLSNGTELALPLMLFVGHNNGGATGGDLGIDYARYYVFTGAVVMTKEYGQLDAERSGLLTETITIGYNRMFTVTSPTSSSLTPWEFNTSGGAEGGEGNIKQKYSKNGKIPMQNNVREATFRNEAVKWEFDENTKAGAGTLSAARLTEKPKAAMESQRREYVFAAENSEGYTGNAKSVRSAANADSSQGSLLSTYKIQELSAQDMAQKARKFEFTDALSKAGNGVLSSRQNSEIMEKSRQDMEGASSEWQFSDKTKDGTGTSSRANPPMEEMSRADMEGRASVREFGSISSEPVLEEFGSKASEWRFEGMAKEGGGDASRAKSPINELSKEQMSKRAVHHIKSSIEDFLMK